MYLKQNVYTCMFNIVFLFIHTGGRHIERNSPNHYAPSSRGILNFSPHTRHCTLHTFTLLTQHCTVSTSHCALSTSHSILHTAHFALHTSYFFGFRWSLATQSRGVEIVPMELMRNTLHPCAIRCTSAWHSKLAGTSNNLAVGSTDFFVTQIS